MSLTNLSEGFFKSNLGGAAMSGLGGLFTGLGAYNQAQSQRAGLGTALGYARKIPGMIEEGYAPGLERFEDLYAQYDPRGGSVFQGLKGTLASSMNAQLANVDPAMRKLLKRSNMQKAAAFMEQQLPQFTQAQAGMAGSLTGLEQAKLGQQIGAQEQIGQLAAAKKSINPTAQAWGSLGATLSSILPFQGGGKVKNYGHGGEVKGPNHAQGGVDAGKGVEVQGGEFVMNANAYNKNKSLLEAMNASDNEVTMMDSIFGEKHSGHGNQVNMQGGDEVYKLTGKGNKLEKKVVETIAKGFQKFENIMGIEPSNTDRQDLGIMGGAMTTASLAAPLGPLAILPAIVGGARLGKRLMTERKNKEEKEYQGGGMVGEGNLLNKLIKKTYGM